MGSGRSLLQRQAQAESRSLLLGCDVNEGPAAERPRLLLLLWWVGQQETGCVSWSGSRLGEAKPCLE